MDTKKLSKLTTLLLTYTPTAERSFVVAEIAQLREVIIAHNKLYYTHDPIISDVEYDQLFRLLQEREAHFPDLIDPDSPTQRLRGQTIEGFTQQQHVAVMQSLANTYSAEEIDDWHASVDRLLKKTDLNDAWSYVIEPKIDGMSVEVVYEYGMFVRAVTRGDGKVGEDITEHAKQLFGLPLTIPQLKSIAQVALTGEIILPKSAFEKLRTQTTTSGSEFANPRNAAAGTLRQLDTSHVRTRGLTVYFYHIAHLSNDFPDEKRPKDAAAQYVLFQERKIPHLGVLHTSTNIHDITTYCLLPTTKEELLASDILCDGLVIKINEFRVREYCGSTNHHPRWAIAYKFPAEQISTQLLDVSFQVGRTGVLTPVAHLAPVQLSGVTIQKATLHNWLFILERGLQLHDYVLIQRSGEVIPYIVAVLPERRDGTQKPIVAPVKCPVCAHNVYLDEEAGTLWCTNTACPAQLKQRLEHFVSRDCMDIAGLGPRIIEELVDRGICKTVVDLFGLTSTAQKQLLRTIPGVAEKKILQIEQELSKAHQTALRRVLYGLSIRHVGEVLAQDIEKAYVSAYPEPKERNTKTLTAFCLNTEKLLEVVGIGPQIVASVHQFFSDTTNIQVINELSDQEIIDRKGQENAEVAGIDVTVVFTGTFFLPRTQLKTLAQRVGVRVENTITNHTTFLIVGDDPGSKVKEATARGIPSLTREDFCARYGIIKSGLDNMSTRTTDNGSQQQSLFG